MVYNYACGVVLGGRAKREDSHKCALFGGFRLLILLGAAAAAAYYAAGYMDGPVITINEPSVIGLSGTLDVTIDTPNADLSALDVRLEQKGRELPILNLASAPADALVREGTRLRVRRPIGKTTLPELQSGTATIKVSAARPVLRRLRISRPILACLAGSTDPSVGVV